MISVGIDVSKEKSETMEINGRRIFGYDEPIIYQRIRE